MGLKIKTLLILAILSTSGCMSPRHWQEIYQGQGLGLQPGEALARYNK